MRLYLVRHGDALPESVDSEKHLSPEGIAKIEASAEFLKNLKLEVEQILHSGKARARQTAEILSKAVHSRRGVKIKEGLNPNDNMREIALELSLGGEDTMIVGHLPFMNRLASYLVSGSVEKEFFKFETASVLCLKSEDKNRFMIEWFFNPNIVIRIDF